MRIFEISAQTRTKGALLGLKQIGGGSLAATTIKQVIFVVIKKKLAIYICIASAFT